MILKNALKSTTNAFIFLGAITAFSPIYAMHADEGEKEKERNTTYSAQTVSHSKLCEMADLGNVFNRRELYEHVAKGEKELVSYLSENFQKYPSLFRHAALDSDSGDVNAPTLLALIFANGWGVKKNPQAASELYTKAMEWGYSLTGVHSTLFHHPELGIETSRPRINEGEIEKIFTLAKKYQVAGDNRTAAKLYKEASDAGHTEALYELGVMFEADKENLSDPFYYGSAYRTKNANATDCYTRAKAQGHLGAQVRLAAIYRRGDPRADRNKGYEIARDPQLSFKLYREAAKQGSNDAQYALGEGYTHHE